MIWEGWRFWPCGCLKLVNVHADRGVSCSGHSTTLMCFHVREMALYDFCFSVKITACAMELI